MNIVYDRVAEAVYLTLRSRVKGWKVARTVQYDENINLDYSRSGRLVGIEILQAKKIFRRNYLRSLRES